MTGARQIGKTWLIRDEIDKSGLKRFEINFINQPGMIDYLNAEISAEEFWVKLKLIMPEEYKPHDHIMLALQESIRPSADLLNHYFEISKPCKGNKEAVIITVNGIGDTVTPSFEDIETVDGVPIDQSLTGLPFSKYF